MTRCSSHTLTRQQRHRGTGSPVPEAKARIQRFLECGCEGVEEVQLVRGHFVEGQRTSGPVQEHGDSTRDRVRGHGPADVSATHVVAATTAAQAPESRDSSQFEVRTVRLPPDSFVTQRDRNTSRPLDFPGTAAAQTRTTQQLSAVDKPVGMRRIRLMLGLVRHRPVVVGQLDVCVHCVCVD